MAIKSVFIGNLRQFHDANIAIRIKGLMSKKPRYRKFASKWVIAYSVFPLTYYT